MGERDEPLAQEEEALTPEMRQLLRRQVVLARLFGYPLALLLAGLTVFVLWLLLALESTDGLNGWVVVVGLCLVAVCGALAWVTISGTRAQIQSALEDLRAGLCVRVFGQVRVLRESARAQIFSAERYRLEVDGLALPIDLYAAYALDGVERAVVTYTIYSRRVLLVRSPAGDLLFSAPGLARYPATSVVVL